MTDKSPALSGLFCCRLEARGSVFTVAAAVTCHVDMSARAGGAFLSICAGILGATLDGISALPLCRSAALPLCRSAALPCRAVPCRAVPCRAIA
jgi:hypothetical protein